MTREGLNVLDADDALVRLLTDTLEAARNRSAEIGEVARHV
jgi:pyrroline-5-carboxylate reductase